MRIQFSYLLWALPVLATILLIGLAFKFPFWPFPELNYWLATNSASHLREFGLLILGVPGFALLVWRSIQSEKQIKIAQAQMENAQKQFEQSGKQFTLAQKQFTQSDLHRALGLLTSDNPAQVTSAVRLLAQSWADYGDAARKEITPTFQAVMSTSSAVMLKDGDHIMINLPVRSACFAFLVETMKQWKYDKENHKDRTGEWHKPWLNLDGANFQGVQCPGVPDIVHITFDGARLTNAKLMHVWFLDGISFKRAKFSGSDLYKAEFSGTKLNEAFALSAIFIGTRFKEADLSKANFIQSDLSGADCTKAELSEVNFSDSNLSQMNFKNAKNLTEEQLNKAGWLREQNRWFEDQITGPPILPDYLQDFDVERMGRVVRDDGPRVWKVVPADQG